MVLASSHYQHTSRTQKGMKIEGCCVSHSGITSIEQQTVTTVDACQFR